VLSAAVGSTVQLGASGDATCLDLMAEITHNSDAFNNGVTELLVLNTKGVSASCLKNLVAEVSKRTAGHFVALLTAEKSDIAETIVSPCGSASFLPQPYPPTSLTQRSIVG
jgi:hypothetical protein